MRKLLFLILFLASPLVAQDPLRETQFWAEEVRNGDLPPITERLPETPLVVDLEAKGRSFGIPGGTLRTMVSRSKDVRLSLIHI